MYNSNVAKGYETNEQNSLRSSQREWSSDSFYDGQIRSYGKPNFSSSRLERLEFILHIFLSICHSNIFKYRSI